MRARERGGFGWKRWSKEWLYGSWDSIMITGFAVHGHSRKRSQPFLTHKP